MTDTKLQKAYQQAEEKRRRKAITDDRDTIPMDFGTAVPFDPIDNPGSYADDPIWKRFWKTEGIRFIDATGNPVSDPMERFRYAFELGYMACRKIEKGATHPVVAIDVPEYPEETGE
jgi:hypothetical protein